MYVCVKFLYSFAVNWHGQKGYIMSFVVCNWGSCNIEVLVFFLIKSCIIGSVYLLLLFVTYFNIVVNLLL